MSFPSAVRTNTWHFPSCVIVDPNTGPCLDIFFRYFNSFPSAIGAGELVHHEWVQYLDYIYDYYDESETSCRISKHILLSKNLTGISLCLLRYVVIIYEILHTNNILK